MNIKKYFQEQRLFTLETLVWVVHPSSVQGPLGTSLAGSRPETDPMIPAPGAHEKEILFKQD